MADSSALVAAAATIAGTAKQKDLLPVIAELIGTVSVVDDIMNGMVDEHCSKFVETILDVTKIERGGGHKAKIIYSFEERQVTSTIKDPGFIETDWLSSPGGLLVANIAKANKGKRALFYKLNVGVSDEAPHGYRQLLWIQPLGVAPPAQQGEESPFEPNVQPGESTTPPRGSEPTREELAQRALADVAAQSATSQNTAQKVAEHLGGSVEYHESDEPF